MPAGDLARLLLIDCQFLRSEALAVALGEAFAVPLATIAVGNGREAAERLRQEGVDIVLMDLQSLSDPEGSSEDAIARVVKLAQGALAVVLSEAATVSAAVGVMRAGAHDFIARPVAPETLATRIGELALRHGKSRLLASEPPRNFIGNVVAGPEPRPGTAGRPSVPAIQPLWRQEQRIIEDAIASFSGNVALAAAALELSPSTIYRKRQAWAEMDNQKGAA